MPQLDAASFPSQLIWLVITIGLLYVILSRVALPRISSVLEERQRRISGDLEKAEQLRAEAEKVLAAHEAAMTETRAKAHALVRQTKDEMAAEAARRQEELAAKIAATTGEAEARIDSARKEAVDNIRQVAVEVAQEATKRLIDGEVESADAEAAVDAVQGSHS
ncbi:MAG: F0F1 ATP synthase subunit B' [Alphaproteobacteria bacterium]|nr:F0F1 ATP synthase subunit B' [Alphaproteobacteria bacterium]